MTFDLSYCSPPTYNLCCVIQLALTCTLSSSMPAITMPSPASRYEGSTWRQITLGDSLEETLSFSTSMLSGELLLQRFMSGPHSCQLSVLIQTKLLPTRRAQYCNCLSLSLSDCPALFCPPPWTHTYLISFPNARLTE